MIIYIVALTKNSIKTHDRKDDNLALNMKRGKRLPVM